MDIHRNIEYARPGGVSLTLDLYLPKESAAPLPVILWIHGGGWQTGSKEIPLMLPMAQFGFALASINYRLSSQAIFPAQIEDCQAAVRWLRANAAKYRLNPDRIGAVGASAGGHLAALLGTLRGGSGTEKNSTEVQAVVDYFGPTDLLTIGREATAEQNANPRNPVVQLLGDPWRKKWISRGRPARSFTSPRGPVRFISSTGTAIMSCP